MEEQSALPNEPPSLSSYLLRFRKLCEKDNNLKKEVLEGKLNLSLDGFRSILWARWLGILHSSNFKEWESDISNSRSRYAGLRAKHLYDSRNNPNLHPSINNPLSQDTQSPWNQFFKDSELRKDIERDVVRSTSEEIRSHEQMKELMQTVLFIYGKEHSDLQYRQGMHEILSSILLVLLDDISACQNVLQGAPESSTLTLIQNLLHPEMVESDVYAIFEKVMEYMWDWYYTPSVPISNGSSNHGSGNGNHNVPFSNQDEHYPLLSNAARRLQNMWVNILQLHDKKLYDHLVNLSILPTTFGVNWTKLLFTRQFNDYCSLWDAVMVTNFTLVDYLVVAMVIAIRSKLLAGDSNTCNTHLVASYPRNINPRYVIHLALYLQDTKKFVRPIGSPFISDMSDSANLAPDDFEFVQCEEKCHSKSRSSSKDSNDETLAWHLERIQLSLAQMEEAMDQSNCNHQLVRQSFFQVKESVNALGQHLPEPKWSQRHKRNTSIAVEALAFEK